MVHDNLSQQSLAKEPFDFDLTLLGYGADEDVPVYDIWEKQAKGEVIGTLQADVPSHGVKLLRLGDNKPEGISVIPQETGNAPRHKDDGIYYNLQGIPTKTPSQGIYIKDGKKQVFPRHGRDN